MMGNRLMNEIDMNLKMNILDSCDNSPKQSFKGLGQHSPRISGAARKLQHSSSEKILNKDNVVESSKILKFQKVRDEQALRLELNSFGKIIFFDNHYLNKE